MFEVILHLCPSHYWSSGVARDITSIFDKGLNRIVTNFTNYRAPESRFVEYYEAAKNCGVRKY